MASYNRVTLMGNMTRDADLRHTNAGSAVAEIGLAINRFWTDRKTNERREETTFIDVTFWGRTAEVLAERGGKGALLHVEGRLQLDQWEDKESGDKRSKLRVVGESVQIVRYPPDED